MSRSLLLPLQVCLALGAAGALAGQQRGPVTPVPVPTTVAAVVTAAEPRSFNVVTVPVPPTIAANLALTFEVESHPDVTVLGRRAGTMAVGERRPVLITIGLPPHALAGRMTAAQVAFRTLDGATTIVPVEFDVRAEHALELYTPPRLASRPAGAGFSFDVQLENRGNVVDTVQVDAVLPRGFRAHTPLPINVVLLPGLSRTRQLVMTTVSGAETGDFFVTVRVLRRGQEVARRVTLVPVGERVSRVLQGPELRTSFTSVTGSGGEAVQLLQADMNGPLTAAVHVNARASLELGALQGLAARGLSGVGAFAYPAELALHSPRWRASLGTLPTDHSVLAGQNSAGRGLFASYGDTADVWSLSVGRPARYGDAGGGEVLVGNWQRRTGGFTLTGSLAHVRAQRDTLVQLDAAAVGLAGEVPRLGRITSELGYRRFDGGGGMGVVAGAERAWDAGAASVRYAHAPGGSRAFARASDELAASVRHTLNARNSLGAAFSTTRDESSAFSELSSQSWSAYHNLGLTRALNVSTHLSGHEYSAGSRELGFGQEEYQLQLSVQFSARSVYASAGGFGGPVERTFQVLDDASRFTGERRGARGTFGWATPFGTVKFETNYERNTGDAAYTPEMVTAAAALERVPVRLLGRTIHLDAGAVHRRYGEDHDATTSWRAGVDVPLPGRMSFNASFERDPMFGSAPGSQPWTFGARITRSTLLPRLRDDGYGVVFQDLNGNGSRDAGEPGMANVTVRAGASSATTDAIGRFYMAVPAGAALAADAATIPYGWVVARVVPSRREIALVPTGAIEVELEIVADENGRKPDVDLSPVNVTAVDAQGRRWLARRTSAVMASFDALPIGTYQLELDFAAASEPLRPRAGDVTLHVEAAASRVHVPLVGRPLRFRNTGGRGDS